MANKKLCHDNLLHAMFTQVKLFELFNFPEKKPQNQQKLCPQSRED